MGVQGPPSKNLQQRQYCKKPGKACLNWCQLRSTHPYMLFNREFISSVKRIFLCLSPTYMRQGVFTKPLSKESDKDLPQISPKLIAVSKTKPIPLIIQAYEAGQRHFGENYVNELSEKAINPEILSKCKDIKWHFIGHLQTNKINKLLSCPGLYIVETVHSEKLAENLNKQWLKIRKDESRLRVMVQINTSGEDAKNGIEPSEATKLVEYILHNCTNLEFTGLMTIGQYDYDTSLGPNPDFITLAKCRTEVSEKLDIPVNDIELSMGMSSDFEHAIEIGATTVRVGSNIFGAREKLNR